MGRKKEKARQAPVQDDLPPIPEAPHNYEGYDGYGQGEPTWQTPDGGGYDDGYGQGEQQWEDQQGPPPGAWDPRQDPQQGWGPPPTGPPPTGPPMTGPPMTGPPMAGPPMTSPVNAPRPSGPAAFADWGQDYAAARPPHMAPQPSPGTQPPTTLPPRGRQGRNDSGAAAGAPSWQNWGREAIANDRRYAPPPPQSNHGTSYGQQSRVAFASQDSYVSYDDRGEFNPQTQGMMYDPIATSRGGAPKESHQRSTRGSAQNSTHTGKQSKRKKERRGQEQSLPSYGGQQENFAYGQDNPEWGQDNAQWAKPEEGYGWGQQYADEKHGPAMDQWGSGKVGRGDLDSEGNTESEAGGGWNDQTGLRDYRQTVSNAFLPAPAGNSPYPMPSRTMAYANGTAQEPLEVFSPGLTRKHNSMDDYANIELLESYGEALQPVENAFFGRDRKARERIHWQFPHDKDERVRHALEWLHDFSDGVGAFGLNKFLQTRERGALFLNASYDSPSGQGPALDWLDYDEVVLTQDRLLQESVGFYDPAKQVIVFVFLPSKSGNSLAMWRRKVAVPSSVRMAHVREIELAKAALKKDYPVWVDEMRSPPYRSSSIQTKSVPPSTKKKKKGFFRRLFRIFKIIW